MASAGSSAATRRARRCASSIFRSLITPGERVLVAGASGTGKSTLVRAIAGL
jgi:ABC-type uncharacterized transport system fused permease/ATPase subunit